jgi:glucosylceramidase
MVRLIPVLFFIMCVTVSAESKQPNPENMVVSSELHPESSIWFTQPPDQSEIRFKLTAFNTLPQSEAAVPDSTTRFVIYPDKRHQSILGIGTSLEETSVYAMLKNKTPAQTRAILRALIDPKHGIGMTLFRVCIGTSDFSDGRAVSSHAQGFYTYQSRPEDAFSIQNDIDLGIVSVLRMALEVAEDCGQEIRFFASAWSPPAWMKSSEALIGGTLKKGLERQLAHYFRKFIEAYVAQGIPIHAITMQNEANYLPDTYPGMKLTWQQERDLVIATFEAFQRTPKIDTRLWIIDHNFEYWKKADRILQSLEELEKKHYVDAAAFHDYSDAPPANMLKLKQRHPQIGLQFSEMSKFGVSGMADIQSYFFNGAQSYVYWVTMSTQTPEEHNQGPWNTISNLSPTMLMQLNGNTPQWIINSDYYLLGQFSRFIRPGAVRLECPFGDASSLTAVAFRNPDGGMAVVLVNQTAQAQPFHITVGQISCTGTVPDKCVATVTW